VIYVHDHDAPAKVYFAMAFRLALGDGLKLPTLSTGCDADGSNATIMSEKRI